MDCSPSGAPPDTLSITFRPPPHYYIEYTRHFASGRNSQGRMPIPAAPVNIAISCNTAWHLHLLQCFKCMLFLVKGQRAFLPG